MATEAAGEGMNLQCCHILFNYDIPWNPNRLEQRMGRIHRYGQRHDCLIFNFVATNTIEGRVLQRLHQKLQEIRDALDDDTVFNVVGEILPSAHVERVLRDYYAGKLGAADLEERIMKDVDEDHFRAHLPNSSGRIGLQEAQPRHAHRTAGPGAGAARRARDHSAVHPGVRPECGHGFKAGESPSAYVRAGPDTVRGLRKYERDPGWKLPELAARYPRLSMDRDTAEKNNLEWVTPGHPLFEALRRHSLDLGQDAFAREGIRQIGAILHAKAVSAPAGRVCD